MAPGEGFILRKVVIDGARAFPARTLAAIARPYIGRRVDLTGIGFIAGRITEKYRRAGCLLSKAVVPQQQVTDGVLHIAVIEGYVARVRTEDAPKDDRFSIVKQTAQKITGMRPL